MSKKKTPTTANLNEIYNKVAAKADTDGLQINVAETKRVIASFFDVLEDYKAAEAFDFVAKGFYQG